MKNNKHYNYEQVLGSFQAEVEDFRNQMARVPARIDSKKDLAQYAAKVWQEKYRDALHPSVIDQYEV